MNRLSLIIGVFVVQVLCALVFVSDILATLLGLPFGPLNWQLREMMEIGAALGLILGGCLGFVLIRAAHRRSQHVESQLRAASGALAELLADRFEEWGLTPAEKDVALFAIKGLSIQDIAALRQVSEGTVKAQTNAIYRKAGVTGRPQLLSLFIEDLLQDRLLPAA